MFIIAHDKTEKKRVYQNDEDGYDVDDDDNDAAAADD